MVIAFIAACNVAIAFDNYYLYLLPVALGITLLALFSADILIYLTAFLVPVSVTFHDLGFGAGLNLPTEPLVIGLMLIAVYKFAMEGFGDKAFIKHPLTIIIGLHLAWVLLTSIFSTMPVVSFKYLISRVWYIVVFYFFASKLFYDTEKIKRFTNLMLMSAFLVVCFVMIRHSTFGFSRDTVTTVITPFFWIHGVYAAMVAMFAPIFLVFFLKGRDLGFSALRRSFYLFCAVLFTLAVVYSYTRAAWLSIFGAGLALTFFMMRVKLSILYSAVIVVILGLVYFQGDIVMELSRNKTGSNSKNMEKHLQSATNIKNDPSNLERLNRWSCAIRMCQDKPVLGFGPGTYMFQYAPYQLSYQTTVISTNFGTLGHAHSEFFGPLAEMGITGMLLWLAVFIYGFIRAVWLIYYAQEAEVRWIVLALFLGLFTYFIHGFLNSYFDYDKIAVPFWAFCAVIVCMDVRNKNLLKEQEG